MNEVPEVFPAYRLVAEFADGQRLAFDGLTEQQAQDRMEAAQAQHGDICWYDGVTDQHYENGKYYKLGPQPPEIIVIDLTDCPDEPKRRIDHAHTRKQAPQQRYLQRQMRPHQRPPH